MRSPSPFFEAEGGSSAARRLLLISPLFPPAEHVGALRWQKMARYVAERGWELDVITLHPDFLPSADWRRLSDLPPGTRLYGVRPPVVRTARLIEMLWKLIRRFSPKHSTSGHDPVRARSRPGMSGRPDSLARSEIRWSLTDPRAYVRAYNAWAAYAELVQSARDMCALAVRIVIPPLHDAIISAGPPHSAHEAARLTSLQTGLPFVMDMRDVWSLTQRCQEGIASPLLFYLARRAERRAIDRAALVVANTHVAGSAMRQTYPGAAERIITVMNGFDDEPLPRSRYAAQFVVAHAGTIYLDRNPVSLFRAAKRVIDDLRLSPDQFALKFMGENGGSVPLTDLADAEGIGAYVEVGEPRPRAEALKFLAQAAMLVILHQDSDMAIPAKVFEYVQFDAWLLALAERDSATELALRDTAADVVSSRDISGIAAVLTRRYQQYAAGVRPARVATDSRLSRRFQADILLEALERHVPRNLVRWHACSTAG